MSKEKQYFAEASYDMVVLITSSDYDVELGEFGPEGRVREDLENLGRTHGVPVASHDVQNEHEFQGVVSSYASKDTLPLFYFYMHGSEDNGLTLEVAREI